MDAERQALVRLAEYWREIARTPGKSISAHTLVACAAELEKVIALEGVQVPPVDVEALARETAERILIDLDVDRDIDSADGRTMTGIIRAALARLSAAPKEER